MCSSAILALINMLLRELGFLYETMISLLPIDLLRLGQYLEMISLIAGLTIISCNNHVGVFPLQYEECWSRWLFSGVYSRLFPCLSDYIMVIISPKER